MKSETASSLSQTSNITCLCFSSTSLSGQELSDTNAEKVATASTQRPCNGPGREAVSSVSTAPTLESRSLPKRQSSVKPIDIRMHNSCVKNCPPSKLSRL